MCRTKGYKIVFLMIHLKITLQTLAKFISCNFGKMMKSLDVGLEIDIIQYAVNFPYIQTLFRTKKKTLFVLNKDREIKVDLCFSN